MTKEAVSSQLLDMVLCPECGNDLVLKNNINLICEKGFHAFRIDSGWIFFNQPPPHVPKPKSYDLTLREHWTNWRRANYAYLAKQLAPLAGSAVILDLGSGEGQFRNLFEKFPNYCGVDFYPHTGTTVVADLTKRLPFRAGRADAILLSNVLEHIPYPAPFLRECYRILRPGGLIIGTVPFLMKIHQKPYDFNRFTRFMLEKVFRDCGFSSIKIVGLGTPFDLYRTVQALFFKSVFKTNSGSLNGERLVYFLVRTAKILNRALNFVFKPVYKLSVNNADFTEGYGFSVSK